MHPTSSSPVRKKKGRPSDPQKARVILSSALAEFYAKGFEGATIEGIAAASGVSKVTIYKLFSSKEGLLKELLDEAVREVQLALASSRSGEEIQARIARCGRALCRFVFHPSSLALARILSMEARRQPRLAKQFFQAAHAEARKRIVELLREAGCPSREAPRLAEDLLSLWFGFKWEAVRMGVHPIPSPTWCKAHVWRGIQTIWSSANLAA